MKQYLDGWLSSKMVYFHDNFIFIDSKLDDGEDATIMEYDHEDGRLWVIRYIKKNLMDTFNKTQDEVNEYLKNWFEKEFKVNVKFMA